VFAVAELIPPKQYDIAWGLIACCLIVLAIVFYITIFKLTQKVKIQENIVKLPRIAGGEERLSLVKNKYVEDIMNIQRSFEANEISDRKAFQALSIVLRNFTHEYSGSGAYAMNLSDLKQNNAPELLLEKIRNYYPLAFEEANRTGNVSLAVQDALKVVSIWR
jgi:hypothetical protein